MRPFPAAQPTIQHATGVKTLRELTGMDREQRERVRALYEMIQTREPVPRTAVCGGCFLRFTESPDCRNHPGICCACVRAMFPRSNHVPL